MNKNDIMDNLKRSASISLLKIKKASPEILVISGVVGVVVGVVLACKETLKANDILSETEENLENIKKAEKMNEEYTEDDKKKDLTIVYTQTAIKFFKLYAPSAAIIILSITSILVSNNILKKRNLALAAAYATIDNSFKEYRKRVIDRFGDEVDKELKYNIKSSDDDSMETNDEKDSSNDILINYSGYAKVFDESCPNFCKDSESNKMFLTQQQAYANQKLKNQGYLFLNEVYEMLGFPRTKAGQIVGWTYDKNGSNIDGDNYVDFNIYDLSNERKRAFVNGYEKAIILDFNVDGNILDLI